MTRLADEVVVRATAAELFALSQDYARRLAWDPFLREARLLDGATEAGVGVRAWCVSRHGVAMETEYVSFDPPHVAAVRMTRGPRLLAAFAGAWRFEPLGDGTTRASFRYHLRARPRWLAWLLEPAFRFAFARETRARLEALKRACEAVDEHVRAT